MDISLPHWRTRLDSLLDRHAHLPYSRFVAAATVRPDGNPANRTLTFRFFAADGNLVFSTDARSEKCAELATRDRVELCWYFTEARVQLRVLGQARLIGAECADHLHAMRRRSWEERSAASRQSFSWPEPGQPLASPGAFAAPAHAGPPPHFLLLLLSPQQADTLDLSVEPHWREIEVLRPDGWTRTPVNP